MRSRARPSCDAAHDGSTVEFCQRRLALGEQAALFRARTIRLPLIGSMPVAGLTAAQVKESVARELAKRQLAANAAVTVTIRRSR